MRTVLKYTAPPLLAAALVLAGCSGGTEEGSAVPSGDGAGQPPPGSTSAPGETGTPNGGAAASLDPCELLSPAELASIGEFEAGEPNDLGGIPGCVWFKPKGADDLMGIGIDVYAEHGLAAVNATGAGKIPGKVSGGDRKILKVPHPAGGNCMYALELSPSSRVDVSVTGITEARGGAERACEITDQVTAIVEPKLPEPEG
ncbi:DUF3558 family protein [Amycolatopsis cihanbeyliensis]|uniref:Uncharacterized protein DUF3558 n=1 Tax=Amycolatopsis cihanbeyliensis TaxID=1128664 RepID=A0A542DKD4_AMYCI|nr:DUF3558 family protein [Amycolatopsis cihanbeyliensis]TQJ03494.1 uncharacterized protein DUF3558 [Amycolatopsis cihanbeyliensis]